MSDKKENKSSLDVAKTIFGWLPSWFTNASMSAANADQPAVTTASGWRRESDGSWNQNDVDKPGVKELRENIAAIGLSTPMTPGGAVLGEWFQLGKGVASTVPTIVKATPSVARATGNAVKSLVTRQVTKEATKQAVKSAVQTGTKLVAKEAPKVGISIAAGKGTDAASEYLTGRTYGENVNRAIEKKLGIKVPEIVGDLANPGYLAGYKYGNFISNNYSNLGRYTLDNLRPFGYDFDKSQVKGLLKTYLQPLYKDPPTFFNHIPKWTKELEKITSSKTHVRGRLENGANWANIPESEIPRKYYPLPKNGVTEPSLLNTKVLQHEAPYHSSNKIRYTVIDKDRITPGNIGGIHSNYEYLGENIHGDQIVKYSDTQKLNPQWLLTDRIKNKFTPGTPAYSFLHKLGGIDLSPLLGYKSFTVEAGIGIPQFGTKYQIPINDLEKTISKPYK